MFIRSEKGVISEYISRIREKKGAWGLEREEKKRGILCPLAGLKEES